MTGLPKRAHGWQYAFRDANARIAREWARAGGARGEVRLWCRPHMLRHSFASKWLSILSVVWHWLGTAPMGRR
jgi:integrase